MAELKPCPFCGGNARLEHSGIEKTIKCAELRKGEICYGDLIIEEPIVEMTIAEIEAKLGIKNLKIKHPAEVDAE